MAEKRLNASFPKVSVIGASGFIGNALMSSLALFGIPAHSFTRQHSFRRGDSLDPFVLDSDVIFYLASGITPAVAESDPQRIADDNEQVGALVDGLRAVDHRPVVVLASSGGTVYDPDVAPPYAETMPTRAASAYGAAKLFQESAVCAGLGWTSPVILRFGNVYGPGQRTGAGYGVIAHWIEALLAGEPIRILGHPQTCRDYVHIADVSSAMLAVYRHSARLRAECTPTVLNIASGIPASLNDVHRGLENAVERALPVLRRPARTFDRRDVWLDVARADEVLGWRPAISLLDGLRDIWRFESRMLRRSAGPVVRVT